MQSNLAKNICLAVFALAILLLSFTVAQSDSIALIGLYLCAFFAYLYLGLIYENSEKLIPFSFILKAILLFAFPLASDDIYRFYWDGKSITQGISPYKHIPSDLINFGINDAVFSALNSKEYYSVYPPFLQFFFFLSYLFCFKSIYVFSIIWKLFLLIADHGSLKLLSKWFGVSKVVYWFAFNPLILYEVFANGHPEGLMLYFLIGFLYYLKQNKINTAGLFLSLATAIKIFPIIFFPLLIRKIGISSLLKLVVISSLLLLLFFIPIYPYFDHFYQSLNLYFKKFEFNGSLFELWRWVDFQRFGFDNIDHISQYLSGLFIIFICLFIFNYWKKNTVKAESTMYWIWIIYLLLASTVHPWYVLPIFLLSLLTSKVSGLYWSMMVVLSYIWYEADGQQFKYFFIGFEYISLFAILYLEETGKLSKIKAAFFV